MKGQKCGRDAQQKRWRLMSQEEKDERRIRAAELRQQRKSN